MTGRRLLVLFFCFFCFGLLVPTAVAATETAPPETLVVPLERIVVTGSRIPETVLRTPMAVSLIERKDFASSRLFGLDEALGNTPGVLVQSRAGAQDVRVTVRGFGARGNGERSNAGVLRGILVLSDGVPLSEPDGRTSLDLADLGTIDRIEVSRSNASALYGNASGGVIHLRSDLSFPDRYASFLERVGGFGFHREQGSVGFVADEGTRATFGLSNTTFDGWREHSESNATRLNGRVLAPLDAATRLGIGLDLVRDLNRYPGPLTAAQLDSAPQQANPTFVARDERRDNRIARAAATLNRAFGTESALEITGYVEPKTLKRSERNRYRDFQRVHLGASVLYNRTRSFSPDFEGRLTAGGDASSQDGSILFYDLAPDGSRGTTLVADQREGARNAGAFLQAGAVLSKVWDVRFALRYDGIRYISEDHIDPALDATKTWNAWTPKATFARLFDAHTVYASLGGGLEAPAFNEIDPPPPYDTLTSLNPFLDPMRSRSYEVGAKGEIGRGTSHALGYDVALYWIDIWDEIVPFDGGAFFLSAGKTRRQGIELWLDTSPAEAWRARASLTLSKNRFEEYAPDDTTDLAGNKVPGLPEVVASAHLSRRLGAGFAVDVGGEVVGSYFADDRNTAPVASIFLLDAMASYAHSLGSGLTLEAFVAGRNLTDRAYVSSVFINGVNGQYYEPGLPANVSAGATLRWQ